MVIDFREMLAPEIGFPLTSLTVPVIFIVEKDSPHWNPARTKPALIANIVTETFLP